MHFSSRRDCPVFLLLFSQVFPNVYFLRFFVMPSVYVCYVLSSKENRQEVNTNRPNEKVVDSKST